MSQNRVRVGQIGLGYWGPNLLRNMLRIPEAEVVAIADLDPNALREAVKKETGIETMTDPHELISRDFVDAVLVATPPENHYELTRAVLEAGKHAFVEKPLALTVEHATELVELANEKNVTLMVGHTFLYNNAVRELKRYIAEGTLGDIYYVYAQRLNLGRVRQDVNALWNFAPHDVSILMYLFGETPTQVTARGFDCLQSGIEDVVFMTLEFPSKRGAHVHISWLNPEKVRRMMVVGSRQMAIYDDVSTDQKIALFDRGVDRIPTNDEPRDFESFEEFQLAMRHGGIQIPPVKFPEPVLLECEHFVECIQAGKEPLSGGQNGLDVVKVLEAAQRSVKQGGAPQDIDV